MGYYYSSYSLPLRPLTRCVCALACVCVCVCMRACVQARLRAEQQWQALAPRTRARRMCLISNLLKVECSVNGSHSMDQVSLAAFGLYKTLPGLDCTFTQ